MGLDMYLERDVHFGTADSRRYNLDNPSKLRISGIPSCIPKRVKSVTEEVCYWRKCNQIHAWFVRECQDGVDECQRAWVAPEKIIELVELCKDLLKDKKSDRAMDLLPPQQGFFFGSYEVDDYYWSDLEYTVKQLSPYVELINEYKEWLDSDRETRTPQHMPWIDFHYQSSW